MATRSMRIHAQRAAVAFATVLGCQAAEVPKPQPPVVVGRGYYAILPNKLLLASHLQPEWKDARLEWTKLSGPGGVRIERPNSAITWAVADQPGKYVFHLAATPAGKEPSNGTVQVKFGPFITPPNHIILKRNDEQTTRGPGHNSVLKFNGKHYIVYHQHNQPHEGGALVFRQTCADLLEFNPDGSIKPVTPTQTGVGPLHKPAPSRTDLARGRYATASSVKSGYHVPEFALDHNHASLWRAADSTYPQSLTVDLGDIRSFSEIQTTFEYPTLSYKYLIETSEDGKAWITHTDKLAEFPVAVSPHINAGRARARFVRITLTACQRPENGAGLYSFQVF